MIFHERHKGWSLIFAVFFVLCIAGLLNALQGCSDDDDDTATFTPTATYTPEAQTPTPTPGTPPPTCTPMPSPPSYWAQYRHDYRHSGYAPFVGPDNPSVAWINDEFRANYLTTDRDGYLYVTGRVVQETEHGTTNVYGLWSLNPDGTVRWNYLDDELSVLFAPIISSTNHIYIIDQYTNILCFNDSGELLWQQTISDRGTQNHPLITSDDNIILTYCYRLGYDWRSTICSLAHDGLFNWKYDIDYYEITFSPVCDTNGNVFFTIEDRFFEPGYMQQEIYTYLVSLDAAGNFRWRFEPTSSVILRGPSLDRFGNVYITTWRELFVFSNDGILLWKKDLEKYGEISSPCPSISENGTIFLGTRDGVILSLDSSGILNWVSESTGFSFGLYIPPISIDSGNTIYFSAFSYERNERRLFCFASNGTLKWDMQYSAEDWLGFPVIPKDNIIYIPANGGLYALNEQ